jgi:hypothetical protein
MNDDDPRTARLRRGGRPSLSPGVPSVSALTRLSAPTHRRLEALATERGESVSSVLRSIVILHLKPNGVL